MTRTYSKPIASNQKEPMKPITFASLALLVAALAGCASAADINVSKVEPKCGQTCAANHSECLAHFSLFPIAQNNACVDALRFCVQSCPARL